MHYSAGPAGMTGAEKTVAYGGAFSILYLNQIVVAIMRRVQALSTGLLFEQFPRYRDLTH
jgi:hypothetical protein